MRRLLAILVCALCAVGLSPRPAAADVTAFWGVSPTPSSRSAKGVAIGLGLLVVGFEFEYAQISEDEVQGAPSLTTGMGNIVVMTPTFKIQLYGTTGGGLFHEQWRDFSTTSFGTNVGGGVKFALAGPVRVRVDYRVFKLNGTPIVSRVQRIYGGLSLSF